MANEPNPIRLVCPACGAPSRYSVADRVYRCASCGTETPPAEQHRRTSSWRSVRRSQIKAEQQEAAAVFSCPGCGAKIAVAAGEATGSCAFCDGSLVRRKFTDADFFPELIVPFRITRGEALEKAERWLASRGTLKEKAAARDALQNLQGCYLPYQFVRGPIECDVLRDASSRSYRCGGFVDEIAVNTSRQLRNEVLDAIEPYDWEETREFNFGYIAGQRVKLQDTGREELLSRVKSEVESDYLPVVERAMHTKGVTLSVHTGELEELPVLLPAYVVSQKDFTLVVNGQTGAVAVTLGKTVNTSRFWFLEPLATTAVCAGAALLISKSVGVALMFAAVVAIVSLVAFGQDRTPHQKLVVHASQKAGDKGGRRAVPVFREQTDRGDVNVRLAFYPPGRVIRNLLGLVLFNLLPLLLAAFFRWSGGGAVSSLQLGYLSLWLVISVPMSFIYWIAYLRRDIYDHPAVREILPDGRTRRLRLKRKRPLGQTLREMRDHIELGVIPAALLLFGLPLLMFIMSIVLLLETA